MKESLCLLAASVVLLSACKSTKETAAVKETLNCGSVAYTLSADIQPLISSNCGGCHGPKSKKAGLDLNLAETIKTVASDGRLVCVTRNAKGCGLMPPGQPLLKSDVDKIECWVNNGMN